MSKSWNEIRKKMSPDRLADINDRVAQEVKKIKQCKGCLKEVPLIDGLCHGCTASALLVAEAALDENGLRISRLISAGELLAEAGKWFAENNPGSPVPDKYLNVFNRVNGELVILTEEGITICPICGGDFMYVGEPVCIDCKEEE